MIIFCNCLLFSSLVPILPIFATIYFYFKLIADKYNLVFTYYRKQESGGRIKTSIGFLMTINLIIYMFTMFGVFIRSTISLKKYFVYSGLFLIYFWLIGMFFIRRYWETALAKKFLDKIKIHQGWSKSAKKAFSKSQ